MLCCHFHISIVFPTWRRFLLFPPVGYGDGRDPGTVHPPNYSDLLTVIFFLMSCFSVWNGSFSSVIWKVYYIIINTKIKGINYVVKRRKILSMLKKDKVQVELLHETHLTDLEHLKWMRDWVGLMYYSSEWGTLPPTLNLALLFSLLSLLF